jgi:UDPglucose 6-dehydrogenase
MKVVVVGLGRLGAPMAAVLATAGATVVGVDSNEYVIRAVMAGRAPVSEPGLAEMLVRTRGRLSATSDLRLALPDADVSFIVVPTPSGDDQMFSLTHVLSAVTSIGRGLAANSSKRHVVVVTSTVMPGATGGPIREALELSSGLTVGKDIGLCYSPEFIALGTVINDLTRPDMILVGESDRASGDVLLAVLRSVTGSQVPVARMDTTSAEVAKLAVNTFVTTKISYANMIDEICESLPGADSGLVTAAVGMDSRIGPKYLRPGAPYGGPCFPRDNAALAALARSLGKSADLAEATDTINRRQVDRVIATIKGYAQPGSTVAVLGLSYKPGTPVRDESFGVDLASRCARDGFDVVAWDPTYRLGPTTPELPHMRITDSLVECLRIADVAVVATAWPELALLPSSVNGRGGYPLVVIDCWHMIDPAEIDPDSVTIHTPGSAETRLRVPRHAS